MDVTSITSYRDLRVWREAMDLVELCYKLSAGFPRREMFGLSAQLRRSAVSIPANIAEGYLIGKMLRSLIRSIQRPAESP